MVPRWYSHYAMDRRIFELKPALASFSNALVLDAGLQATAYERSVAAVVHEERFWERAAVMRAFLQPLVMTSWHHRAQNVQHGGRRGLFWPPVLLFQPRQADICHPARHQHGRQGLLPPAAKNQIPTFMTNQDVQRILTHLQWRHNAYYDLHPVICSRARPQEAPARAEQQGRQLRFQEKHFQSAHGSRHTLRPPRSCRGGRRKAEGGGGRD